jgi:hypothetical protein
MKFFPIRYWWTDRRGEHTATSVASGTNADDARARFCRDHPHLEGRAAIIETKPQPQKAKP